MTKLYIVSSGITLTARDLNDYVELKNDANLNLIGGTVTKNIWGLETFQLLELLQWMLIWEFAHQLTSLMDVRLFMSPKIQQSEHDQVNLSQ